jgi:hypothetical protein
MDAAHHGEMLMRGRLPAGPEYVDKLEGSALAKQRTKAVLQTLDGSLRLQEACRDLDVCEQRLHQLRQQALQAAVAALEPGQPGRPAHTPTPADDKIRALEAELTAVKVELQAARVREEIAITLQRAPADAAPADGTSHGTNANGTGKKTRGRPRTKPRPPPSGTRTNT